MTQTTPELYPYQIVLGNFSNRSCKINYKMNFQEILFYPLSRQYFVKITEIMITSSHYSVL